MKVLVACEFSGIVRDAFQAKGHDAWSCDLFPAEGQHIHGEALEQLDKGWDLLIAHPPCTYLCNSGIRWIYEDKSRFRNVEKGAFFFRKFLEAPIEKICVENPVMHRFAKVMIGRGPDQFIQPWEHGHGEIKTTGLWLKGLPLLKPSLIVPGRVARVHFTSASKNRWAERSVTYPGIAKAMAEQWS